MIGLVQKQTMDEPAKTVPAPVEEQTVKAATAIPDYVVYIGPSIRAMIAKNAIISKDEMGNIDQALERFPEIKHLLIPGDQLGEARAQIKNPDSFLAQVYGKLAINA